MTVKKLRIALAGYSGDTEVLTPDAHDKEVPVEDVLPAHVNGAEVVVIVPADED